MKHDIHPEYNNVCFVDISTGKEFPTRSTLRSKKKRVINGVEYYEITCDVTSDSHPVYTGEKRLVDTAGRVEKFQKRSRRGSASK